MTPLFRKFLGLNWLLFLTMIGLIIVGVFCIYSAVHFRTDAPGIVDMWSKQIRMALLGLVVFFGAALIDYRWMRWGALPMFMVGLGGLVLVLFIGKEVYGTKGWLVLGPLTFQPSQTAIGAGIVMLGFVLGELHKLHPFFRYHFVRLVVAGVCTGVPLLLVLKQGDLGSALVWVPVSASMFLVGSIPYRYLIAIGLIGLAVLPPAYFFALKPYQQERIKVQWALLKGEELDQKSLQGPAYASVNVVRAIGSAGWTGKGFQGKNLADDQKTMHQLGFIPRQTAHNDFIYAVYAEEQGFRGSLLMVGAFAFLVFQCVFVAFCARDQMGRLIVVGVAALFFAHVFQNIGMQVHLLPITGIPLPFISYGGTFVVMIMALLGMVQSVWIHRNDALQEDSSRQEPDSKTMWP